MTDSKSILLVEDNPKDVELTLTALAEYDLAHDVVAIPDGEEALDYLLCRGRYAGRPLLHPGVVLLDLKMPRINGREVLREIKTHPELQRIPVVILTSSRETPDLEECYKLGANAYVVKPVSFTNFVEAVKKISAFWVVLNEPPPGCATKKPRPIFS